MFNYFLLCYYSLLSVYNRIVNYDKKLIFRLLIIGVPVLFFEQFLIGLFRFLEKVKFNVSNFESYFWAIFLLINIIILVFKKKNNYQMQITDTLPITTSIKNSFQITISFLKIIVIEFLIFFPYLYVNWKNVNSLGLWILLFTMPIIIILFKRLVEYLNFKRLNVVVIVITCLLIILWYEDILLEIKKYFSKIVSGELLFIVSWVILVVISLILLTLTIGYNYKFRLKTKQHVTKKKVIKWRKRNIVLAINHGEILKLRFYLFSYIDNLLYIFLYIGLLYWVKDFVKSKELLMVVLGLIAAMSFISVTGIIKDDDYNIYYRVLPIKVSNFVIGKILLNGLLMSILLVITLILLRLFSIWWIGIWFIIFVTISLLSILIDLILIKFKISKNVKLQISRLLNVLGNLIMVMGFIYLYYNFNRELYLVVSIIIFVMVSIIEYLIIKIVWENKKVKL